MPRSVSHSEFHPDKVFYKGNREPRLIARSKFCPVEMLEKY
jgi:hypothetical protein